MLHNPVQYATCFLGVWLCPAISGYMLMCFVVLAHQTMVSHLLKKTNHLSILRTIPHVMTINLANNSVI